MTAEPLEIKGDVCPVMKEGDVFITGGKRGRHGMELLSGRII